MSNSPIISIENLNIGYNKTMLIENISFSLESGDILGVLGRNGSGKSTFLKTLLSLNPGLGGEIVLNRKKLSQLTATEVSEIVAAVLQERAFGSLSVEETVMLGRLPYRTFYSGPSKQESNMLNQLLEKFELTSYRKKRLNDLSDGERQKVMIARALMQDTPVVVLDEPTVFLDVINSVEVFRFVTQSAKEENKTWIFSTHQIELALQICSHLLVLEGKSYHFGSVQQLQNDGVLSKVYGKQGVHFDASTGRVTL